MLDSLDVSGRLALSFCAGFDVLAEDGPVGVVETPLFPPSGDEPDFLIVRAGGPLRHRRPVVAIALVAGVDPTARVVRLQGSRQEIEHLPEHLPLAI
jgi:hypothetical protein